MLGIHRQLPHLHLLIPLWYPQTTTNHLDFILEDCADSEGEVPNTIASVLEMATLNSFVVSHQMEMGVHDIMQQILKQLVDVVKPMVINEI